MFLTVPFAFAYTRGASVTSRAYLSENLVVYFFMSDTTFSSRTRSTMNGSSSETAKVLRLFCFSEPHQPVVAMVEAMKPSRSLLASILEPQMAPVLRPSGLATLHAISF